MILGRNIDQVKEVCLLKGMTTVASFIGSISTIWSLNPVCSRNLMRVETWQKSRLEQVDVSSSVARLIYLFIYLSSYLLIFGH